MQYAREKYNKINYRQALIKRVISSYYKREGGEITIMVDQDHPDRRRAEEQAVRRVGKSRTLENGLADYASDPNETTRRTFAELIDSRLGIDNRILRVEALMALMSSFELMLKDRIVPVAQSARNPWSSVTPPR